MWQIVWRERFEWNGEIKSLLLASKLLCFDVICLSKIKINSQNDNKNALILFFFFFFSVLGISQARFMPSRYECSYYKGKYYSKVFLFICWSFLFSSAQLKANIKNGKANTIRCRKCAFPQPTQSINEKIFAVISNWDLLLVFHIFSLFVSYTARLALRQVLYR